MLYLKGANRVFYRCQVWSMPGIAGERWLRHRLFGIPLHQCHQVVCANMYTPKLLLQLGLSGQPLVGETAAPVLLPLPRGPGLFPCLVGGRAPELLPGDPAVPQTLLHRGKRAERALTSARHAFRNLRGRRAAWGLGPLAVGELGALRPREVRLGASERPAAGGGSGVPGRGGGAQRGVPQIHCEGHCLKVHVKHTLKQQIYLE
ncbi:unnamed protein product [Gadus morhua 'NCC']